MNPNVLEVTPLSAYPNRAPQRAHQFKARLAAATLALSMVVTGLLGPKRSEAPEAAPYYTTVQECSPPPGSAEGWEIMMDKAEGFLLGDGLVSATLPDGQLFMLASDNLANIDAEMNNNALISFCGQDAKSLKPRQNIIPSFVKGEAQWPTAVEVITTPDGETKLIATTYRVKKEGSGPFSFKILGTNMAVFSVKSGQAPEFEALLPMPSTHAPEVDADGSRNILWGSSMVKDDAGNLIMYGQKYRPGKYNFGRDVYASRFNWATQTYEFWSGSRKKWVTDPAKARAIITSTKDKPGLDASWKTERTEDGRYRMVAKAGPFDNVVREFVSDAPTGPFTVRTVAKVEGDTDKLLSYVFQIHRGVKLRSGKTLASISILPLNVPREFNRINPECYSSLWFELDLDSVDEGAIPTFSLPFHCRSLGSLAGVGQLAR